MDSEEAMNQARREKQLFLKAEIIDEGYSGQDFADFLDSKKPEGTKISLLLTLRWQWHRHMVHGRASNSKTVSSL